MFPNPRLLHLTKNSRPWLILTILVGFLSGILTISQAGLISRIISRVFLEAHTLGEVRKLLLFTLGVLILRAALVWFSSLSAKAIAVEVKTRVRRSLLEKIKDLGPAYLGGEKSGEISSTVVEGVEALDLYFSQYLPQLVLSALVPLTILVFVFPQDILSGFVLLVTAPLIPYFMYLIGSQAKKMTDRQFGTLSRLAAQFLDSLGGLTTLKLYNQAKAQSQKIRDTSDEYRKTTMKVLQVTFLSALALELLATLSTAVVAVEIGLRLLYFRVSLEGALFLLMIAPEFYIPLRLLGLRFHAGMEGQSAATRIFEILGQEPLRKDEEGSTETGDLNRPIDTITLEGVSFSYPGEERFALKDLNITIHQGESIALVGESGAGKSTLASLLLGFFPPSEGEIKINSRVLRDGDLDRWREKVAWVPQNPALFQDTIAANIRLARPEADHGAVAAAASAAHLAEFIESTPAGYQTRIGEGGSRLSGGQAQRLALARAFLKDAPVLLLDEPTSQLDPVVETQLADSTRKLMRGRTTITIAHRFNTIYQADRILVLKNGSLVEEGKHQELIDKGGVYRDLVQAYTGGIQEEEILSISEEDWEPTDLKLDPPQDLIESPSEAPPDLTSQRSIFKRLLGFFRPYWGEVGLSVLLGFLTIGSSVSLMGVSAWLISTAALHPPLGTLQVAIVGVRFFGILRGVSRYAERLVSHNLTFKILTRIRVWFYQSLVPLAPARLMRYRSGDLLSRIISDIKVLEDFYVRTLSPPLVAVLVGLGTSIFLGYYRPDFALVLIAFFTLSGLLLPLLIRALAHQPGIQLVRIRGQLVEKLVGFTQGLPDLMSFGRVEAEESGLEILNQDYNRSQLRLAAVSGLGGSLVAISRDLAMWLVLILAIPLVSSGELPGVILATLGLMVLASFEAVQPLTQAMETLSSSLTAGSRLLEVLDAEPAVKDPKVPAPFPSRVLLEAKDLHFSYPGARKPVLDGLDFKLEEGSILAVVGPSGSGKTTLTNLLLRFWGGYGGKLIFGPEGMDLISIAEEEIRKNISVVSQRGYLFNDTIRANLKLGRPDASDGEMIEAAHKARIHDLIQSLPEGYDTVVGERGYRFSAGERQRMEIARALLKDAPLVILDEPTANLDPITERAILATLFEILKGKTALLITHRLVELNRAEQILVLDGGRIVERGTEKHLLGSKGFYRKMWGLQNRILSY